jgi:hypothetical protein
MKPGSPHLAFYPGSGEQYCRTCKMDSFRRATYGIDTAMRDQMLQEQEYLCKICKEPFTDDKYFIDHSHKDGHTRGILCVTCNALLGMAYDNIKILESAITYLLEDG